MKHYFRQTLANNVVTSYQKVLFTVSNGSQLTIFKTEIKRMMCPCHCTQLIYIYVDTSFLANFTVSNMSY